MTEIEALIRIIIDGQAYLYAQHYKLMAELMGRDVGEAELEEWQDEWKSQTAELVTILVEGDSLEEASDPS